MVASLVRLDHHADIWRTRISVPFAVLLAPILLLMLAHWSHLDSSPQFSGARWDVHTDRSYMEILGYVELTVAAAILVVLAVRSSVPVYAGWSVALVVLVLDDSLTWHERAGAALVRRFPVPDPPGLRPQDLGELATWALLGVVVSVVLFVTHIRSSSTGRRDSRRIMGIIAVLMVFAVALDMFVIAVYTITSRPALLQGLNDLEAAGEVAAMGGLLAYAVHMVRRARQLGRPPVEARGSRGTVTPGPVLRPQVPSQRLTERAAASEPGGAGAAVSPPTATGVRTRRTPASTWTTSADHGEPDGPLTMDHSTTPPETRQAAAALRNATDVHGQRRTADPRHDRGKVANLHGHEPYDR